jgi:outer membrane protein
MSTTKSIKMAALGAAMAAVFTAAPVTAFEAGDIIVRVGGAKVTPDDSADGFDGPTAALLGSKLEPGVQNDFKPSLIVGYMVTDNIGLQLLAAVPFEHDITANLDGTDLGKVAKTRHLPPTLTLNWHFDPIGVVSPFVGAGVNYTHFFDESTTGVLDALGNTVNDKIKNINLDDSWGAAGTVGFDADLGDNFLFNMTLYYIDIDTEAFVGGGVGNSDVDVDPWVLSTGFGYKF